MTTAFQKSNSQLGIEKRLEQLAQLLAEFKEDRDFLRSFGMDDRKIAERLGYEWASYRRRFLRHPELADPYPMLDPVEIENRSTTDWTSILRPERRKR